MKGEAEMDQWEYKWMFVNTDVPGSKKPNLKTESGIFAVKASITQMGRQGWELVSVVPLFASHPSSTGGSDIITHDTLWVFKKKKKLSITIR